MYRLVIADDELLIREALASRAEWGELGFQIAASLEDGAEVLEHVKRHGADALLLDIRMFEVTGLEVARRISESYPWIRVVLLSGYQEFQYAKEAMRYGVYDYLVKPIDYEELWRLFARLRDELDRERREKLALSAVSESDYMQLLSQVRSILNAVMDTGEETWMAYARMIPVFSEATEEVRAFIVRRLLDQLRAELRRGDGQLAEALESRLEAVGRAPAERSLEEMLQLLKQLNDQVIGHKMRGWDDSIAKACKYIANHINEDISYTQVAEFVHLSPRHFIRRFQSERGETFTEYLIRTRMNCAMQLLAEGGYSTDAICRAVGYRDEKHFRQLFKKFAGCSPREYVLRVAQSPPDGDRLGRGEHETQS